VPELAHETGEHLAVPSAPVPVNWADITVLRLDAVPLENAITPLPNVKAQGKRVYAVASTATGPMNENVQCVGGVAHVKGEGKEVVANGTSATINGVVGYVKTGNAADMSSDVRVAKAEVHNAKLRVERSRTELDSAVAELNVRMRAINVGIEGVVLVDYMKKQVVDVAIIAGTAALAAEVAGSAIIVGLLGNTAQLVNGLLHSDRSVEAGYNEIQEYGAGTVTTIGEGIAEAEGAKPTKLGFKIASRVVDAWTFGYDLYELGKTPLLPRVSATSNAAGAIRVLQRASNAYWYGDDLARRELDSMVIDDKSRENLRDLRKIFDASKKDAVRSFSQGKTPFDRAALAVQSHEGALAELAEAEIRLSELLNPGVVVKCQGVRSEAERSATTLRTISDDDYDKCINSTVAIECKFTDIPVLPEVAVVPEKKR